MSRSGTVQPLRKAGELEGCPLASLLLLDVVACAQPLRKPLIGLVLKVRADYTVVEEHWGHDRSFTPEVPPILYLALTQSDLGRRK